MDQKKKNYIKKAYIDWLKEVPVKDGALDWLFHNTDQMLSLAREIRKDCVLESYTTTYEVFDKLYKIIGNSFQNEKFAADGPLKNLCGPDVFEEVARQLISFLEGIPYKYDFYIKLPFALPEKIDTLPLSAGTKIIKRSDGEWQHVEVGGEGSIGKLFSSYLLSRTSPHGAYFKTEVSGYGDAAEAKALSVFKRFAYLASAAGLISSSTYDLSTDSEIKNLRSVSSALNEPAITQLPNDIANYISGIKLNKDVFKEYKPPSPTTSRAASILSCSRTYEEFYESKFSWHSRAFAQVQSHEESADYGHILSAIEWGFDGSANANETMGFIQVCIGLEALLGDKNSGGQRNLTEKLADRCAYLLGHSSSDRKDYAKKFEKIYALRCELVHGVRPKLAEEHGRRAFEAEALLRALVLKEINLLSARSEKSKAT